METAERDGRMRYRLDGMEIEVFDGVYPPSEDTFLLMDSLKAYSASAALELCTGSGAVSVSLARRVRSIVATDVNPAAARNARHNLNANGCGTKAEVIVGDLFSPIAEGSRFDLIFMNPPYLPDDGTGCGDLAWEGGPDGRRVIDRFIKDVKRFLAPGGRAIFLQSTINGVSESIEALESQGMVAKVVGTSSFQFEGLVVIEASMGQHQKE
uniref:Methyltransferase domain-containing protein n=1 Tax=Candidatus Methanomethylicus mesodigestus TaxID=1867258 RepID=A0A7C3J4S7_9CREN